MKKIKLFLLTIVVLAANTIHSQDFSKVDALIKTYPNSFSNPKQLAEKINQDFVTENEKSRAIFTWIAFNIRYDLAAYNSQRNNAPIAYSFKNEEEKITKEQAFRADLANKTLRSKKGVCQGYATLFLELCNLTGIKCITITGTSKTNKTHIGKLPTASDHMWNAIKLGESWKLIDVTWASGSVDGKTRKFVQKFNDGYFCTPPELFYLNHFPDDKRLLMIEKSPEAFAALPLYYGGYLQSDYEFVSPENGILSYSKSNVIAFEIVDLPTTDNIAYVLSNDEKFNPIAIKRSANSTTFEIPIDKKSTGFLTIFVNNRAIVSYKIEK